MKNQGQTYIDIQNIVENNIELEDRHQRNNVRIIDGAFPKM